MCHVTIPVNDEENHFETIYDEKSKNTRKVQYIDKQNEKGYEVHPVISRRSR